MSDKTGIEWTDATWNPTTGCSKVSQGCKNCYALRDWPRLAANPKSVYFGRAFTNVQCHPERLRQPLQWKKPRRIFVNSMSDLFHEDVPRSFVDEIFHTMVVARQHSFQVLTKRPWRMLDFMAHRAAPPPNVWLGVSVEDQATADERIPVLLQTSAAIRWLSVEPLLGPIDLELRLLGQIPGIDWVVVGGESGPHARAMRPEWASSIRDQCARAGVPFLFKQWGEWFGGRRVGKKNAGRTLAGVLHDAYPSNRVTEVTVSDR